MKPQINNESKARFFALYWNQLVMRCEGDNFLITNIPERWSTAHWLELTSLQDITDEDAIEVVKIVRPAIPYILNPKNARPFCEGYLSIDNGISSLVADYLRSCGYALPYMGLSVEEMIEAGWIKLKAK